MSKQTKKQGRSSSLVQKLFVSYQLIFTLPLILIVLLNYYNTSENSIARAHDTYAKTLGQTSSYISYKASSIRNIIDIISYDSTIQNVITQSQAYYRSNSGNWIIQTADVKNIIFNTYSTPDIVQIRLYMNEGLAAIEETNEFKRMSSAEQTDWYKRLNEESRPTWQWFPPSFFGEQGNADYVSFIKKIPSLNAVNRFIGIIKADVKQSIFLDILEQSAITANSSLLLYNDYGESIAALGLSCMESGALEDTLKEQGLTASSDIQHIELDGEAFMAGFREIDDTDWTLLMLISYDDILTSEVATRNQMIGVLLLLVLISVPITYGMSRRFTLRIRKLADSMRCFSKNESGIVRMKIDKNDEVALLSETFNQMVDDTQLLMERQYQQGKAIQTLELRVLQAQINPHFLYNTLDMIRWMAMRNHTPDIATTVERMAAFYKLSLGHGEETVTLEKEIQHVTSYFYLQNMRFNNKLKLIVDVPEELMPKPIIKIILQPIVENSIMHGILEKEDPEGTVWINTSVQDGILTIAVHDDGVGMPKEKVESILRQSALHDGYGVKNIDKRLRIHYGEVYGLRFESELGYGTTAFITIPIVGSKENPESDV